MENIVAVVDREVPTVTSFKICFHERKLAIRVGASLSNHRLHFGFPLQVADGRSNGMALAQKLNDAVAANESGTARNQYSARILALTALAAQDWFL